MVKGLIFAGALLASGAASAACFLSGEQTSGMNKICFYDCVGGTKAINVKAYALCPMSISQVKKIDYLASVDRPVIVAHSGGTDSNGCHRDTKSGTSHCH